MPCQWNRYSFHLGARVSNWFIRWCDRPQCVHILEYAYLIYISDREKKTLVSSIRRALSEQVRLRFSSGPLSRSQGSPTGDDVSTSASVALVMHVFGFENPELRMQLSMGGGPRPIVHHVSITRERRVA